MSDVLCNIRIHAVIQFNNLHVVVSMYLPDDGFVKQKHVAIVRTVSRPNKTQ
jgi:hypothetical protein